MKELELKGCPSCGILVVGEKKECVVCFGKLAPVVLQTLAGWSVVPKDPNAKEVRKT